jgi:hypothetical protein
MAVVARLLSTSSQDGGVMQTHLQQSLAIPQLAHVGIADEFERCSHQTMMTIVFAPAL